MKIKVSSHKHVFFLLLHNTRAPPTTDFVKCRAAAASGSEESISALVSATTNEIASERSGGRNAPSPD